MKTSNRTVISAEKEVVEKIMSTTVYIKVCDNTGKHSQEEIQKDIDSAFKDFEEFESKYSRFIKGNELDKFNCGEPVKLTEDFIEMVKLSIRFNKETFGMFNISLLDNLKSEGYVLSKNDGFTNQEHIDKFTAIGDPKLLKVTKTKVTNPAKLKIEFGGIGKGYIVDKVSKKLGEKYSNFIVDAGGDIRFEGQDLDNNFNFWSCGLENPLTNKDGLFFKLQGKSIATSSSVKRTWSKDGVVKNHIINPLTGKSVENEVASATVIANTTAEADVFSKTILMFGVENGIKFADSKNLACVLICKNGDIIKNEKSEKFIYENESTN
jgi:thiamine biosynthesis lipoprotein